MRRYASLLKIICIVLLSLTGGFLFLHKLYFTTVLVGIGILMLAYALYREQRKTLRKMEHVIANIHYGDLNLSIPSTSLDRAEEDLARSMNEALSAFRSRLYNSVMAEAETEAWQKLIRVLTHEIMNSIAPIISLSETVTERAVSNGMNEKDYAVMLQAIQTIHRRSKGLLDFVENYRKLTRIPAPTPLPFLVSALFKDLERLFPSKTVGFIYTIRPENLQLYADRALIEQVLINLLKNAVEATSQIVQPNIRVEAVRKEGMIVIIVTDNGPGILPEALDKIFVPFFTTKQGGSGIGLSVCRQIMNRHGGHINVTSDENEGTTFTLCFPVHSSILCNS